MRFWVITVLLALTFFVLFASAQGEGSDPYSISVVQFEWQMRSGRHKMTHSFSQKHVVRLGDGISIALLKILNNREIVNPKSLTILLSIIREAFSQPSSITIEANRKPQITLLLLDRVRQSVNDPQRLAEIERTAAFVREQTKEAP